MSQSWVVSARQAGLRLDVTLAALLGASRAEVRRLLSRGRVLLDGRPVGLAAKGTLVHDGATLEVESFRPPDARVPIPEPEAPLHVLAEGPGWLAVDKPAGTPVHPLEEAERGTLLNAAMARHPEMLGVGEGGLRSGVVHRLDVGTSGALLLATEREVWSVLRSAFRQHRVDKTYRALVAGELHGGGELALDLVVAQHRPARVRVVSEGSAKSRRTRMSWRALQVLDGATLVEARPATGFLHQIRVSLAHLGHPVLGDTDYGAPPLEGAERPMLHAAAVSHRDVAAASPDAPDFAALLARLGGAGGGSDPG